MIQETEAAASFIARFAKECSSSSGSAIKSCPINATSAQNNTNLSKVTPNTASSSQSTPPPLSTAQTASSSQSSQSSSSAVSSAVSSSNVLTTTTTTTSSNGLTNGSDSPPPSAGQPGTAPTVSNEQIQDFIRSLSTILQTRFRNHWFPEKPSRGQGYRCIRINRYNRIDSSIEQACQEAGIKYSDLKLPNELTIWIDPFEVACRFGEHVNTHCIIAKFSDGRIENYVNIIDIDELEAQSFVQLRMHEYEIINPRQKNKTNLGRAAPNTSVPGPSNGNQRTPHSTPSSVYRSPHVNGTSGLSNGVGGASSGVVVNGRLAGPTSSPHVPVTSSGAGAAYSMSNGAYVEYANGANLMPVTSSSVVNLQQQYGAAAAAHAHAYTNGQSNGNASANAGFFAAAAVAASAAGSPGPQFHQIAAAAVHSAGNAFGSPGGQHIYQKFNHLAMSSQHSGLTNGRSMNGAANGNGLSMSPSDYQSVALDKDRRHMASAATAIVANRY